MFNAMWSVVFPELYIFIIPGPLTISGTLMSSSYKVDAGFLIQRHKVDAPGGK